VSGVLDDDIRLETLDEPLDIALIDRFLKPLKDIVSAGSAKPASTPFLPPPDSCRRPKKRRPLCFKRQA
jgi:hypothetical protein